MSESKSESKNEGKVGELQSKPGSSSDATLMRQVQEFCMSNQVEKCFERFAEDNADVFLGSEAYTKNMEEHPLEFHEVYRRYLTQFEGMIEDFIVSIGFTAADFYKKCRQILDDNEQLLSSERFFIETILATSEYENFYLLMRAEMQTISRARAAAANDRDSHK